MSTQPAAAKRKLTGKKWGAIALATLLIVTAAVLGIAAATGNLFAQVTAGPGVPSPSASDFPDDDAPSPSPTPAPTAQPTEPETPEPSPSVEGPELAEDVQFWVDPDSQAARAVATSSGEEAQLLNQIAQVPQAVWVGDWIPTNEITGYVAQRVTAAQETGTSLILVVYAIPGRDCGNHSAGGVAESEYRGWIDAVAQGLWQSDTWVILEPDALAQLGDCDGQGDRVGMLRDAAQKLAEAGNRVYIDAGHSQWHSPAETASRLSQIGFDHAAGFSLNVSNYNSTPAETQYGHDVIAALGQQAQFVIDTSRNGNGGVPGQWCNVPDQAIGAPSQTVAPVNGDNSLQAYLWVKRPGESDGNCNGGPAAGEWWQQGALALVRNAN